MKSQSEKEFDNISDDLGYKVGDKYEQMTLGYFLNLQEGGDDEYLGEEYIECTVKRLIDCVAENIRTFLAK